MRVLGVDPGLTRCGIGVVEGTAGRPLIAVHVEVLTTTPTDDLAARLLAISDGLDAAVARFRPDAVAVERVFAQQNLRTVTGTAQASGLAMVAASRHGVRVASHTPSEVKAAITGSGRADKAQVTAMVTRILNLETAPRPADAADALALAICHIWRGVAIAKRDEAVRLARVGRPVAVRSSAARSGAARLGVVRSGGARSKTGGAKVLNVGEDG